MRPIVVFLLAPIALTGLAAQSPTPSGLQAVARQAVPIDPSAEQGWQPMFDGKTLNGWDGNPEVWKVTDGVIWAETTDARRVSQTQLIWKGGEPADFEWFLEMKLDARVHSGISYRSAVDMARTPTPEGRAGQPLPFAVPPSPQWTLYGLNFDFDYDGANTGNIQELGSTRRIIARRGELVEASPSGRRVIGSLAGSALLRAVIKNDDWNQLLIVARGHQVAHILNGHVVAVLIDDDPSFFKAKGLLGLQLENYNTGRVNFRNLWIRSH